MVGGGLGEHLAGWARMDHIEPAERIRHGVGLVELEWVTRLGRDVHANNVEARPRVPHCGTASAAEKIEQARLHAAPRIYAMERMPRLGARARSSLAA